MDVPGTTALGFGSVDILKMADTEAGAFDELVHVPVQPFGVGHVLFIGQRDPAAPLGVYGVGVDEVTELFMGLSDILLIVQAQGLVDFLFDFSGIAEDIPILVKVDNRAQYRGGGSLMTDFNHISGADYRRAGEQTGVEREALFFDKDIFTHRIFSRCLDIIKYREQAKIAEDDAIVMEAGVKHPNLVITKRPEDCGLHSYGEKSVYRIPAPAFLYLLGYVEQVRNGK